MLPNTLAALESIEHLGEVARLISVFTRRGILRIEETALVEACKRTAGLAGRYPRPKPALALAINIGLLRMNRHVVVLTEPGRVFSATGDVNGLDLSETQKQLLLGALLDDEGVESGIKVLLNKSQVISGQLLVRKSAVPIEPYQLLLCRLLQQVGALRASGDYYALVKPFDKIIERQAIHSSRLSQAELWERLERQRKRGELAEQTVVELEKQRLLSINRADLATKVHQISIDDVSAGYDVESFESTGKPRYIEVKSSVGSQIMFEWSEGERSKARLEGSAYYIYFIPFSFSLPYLSSSVIAIQNPISQIANGALMELPSNYKVREAAIVKYSQKTSPAILIGGTNKFSGTIATFGQGVRMRRNS